MSKNPLDAIRAKLQAMDSRTQKSGSADKSLYPHWNIPDNTSSVIRFLPDADANNTFFWKEKQMIKLPFNGIKDQDENKSIIVQVPCVEMWGDNCPVLTEIRPWFNDDSLKELARSYWKKRSYLFQGFIIEDGLHQTADDLPENPIRRFIMNPSIFKLIKASLLDPDMENIPTDYQRGTDFKITKTKDGQWADYSTSKYVRNETALTEHQLQAIAQFGLFDLNSLMPNRPTAEGLRAIEEMFEASINGELYDLNKWGEYYRPFGVDRPADSDSDTTIVSKTTSVPPTITQPKASVAPATVVEDTDESDDEFESEDAGAATMSAQAILDKLRKRT